MALFKSACIQIVFRAKFRSANPLIDSLFSLCYCWIAPGGKKKLIWEVFMYGERAKENRKQNKLEIKLSVQLGVSEKTSSVH